MDGVHLDRSAGSVDAGEQLAAGVQRAAQQAIERLEATVLQMMKPTPALRILQTMPAVRQCWG